MDGTRALIWPFLCSQLISELRLSPGPASTDTADLRGPAPGGQVWVLYALGMEGSACQDERELCGS